jgi:hypothetical protein
MAHHRAALQALDRWCRQGAGPATAAWWLPWAPPRIEQRLAVAVWTGPGAAPLWPVVEAFCRDIDGSQRLLALPSRGAGWAWRLRIKLWECAWWHSAPNHLPWDAGQIVMNGPALARLDLFRPRRATLMVARDLTLDQTNMAVRQLQGNSHHCAHAVRLLLVQAPGSNTSEMTGRARAPQSALPIQVFDWPGEGSLTSTQA